MRTDPSHPRSCGALAVAVLAAALGAACSAPRMEPLQLDGNLLTAVNQSETDWTDVEIWINRQFRATARTISAGQVFRAPLDHFVTGHGQRFDFSRMQIRDVRLMGRGPDGVAFEIRKQYRGDALADALKGVGGQR